jgi:hypothetical protein
VLAWPTTICVEASEGAVLQLVMFPIRFLLASVALAKTVRALQQGKDI